MNTRKISINLVSTLIIEQFPQWSHLAITPVEPGGWDNNTFRLGNKMSIRLPSAQEYAAQVPKEQTWLPHLAPHLSFQIPKPLAMGEPSHNYPWHWSIYQWIAGKSADAVTLDDKQLTHIAHQLAQFLNELHMIDASGGPEAGTHNFYRGRLLAIYDHETRSTIIQLQNHINTDTAIAVWETALNSQWNKKPVWVHGDFSASNILIKNNQLSAVIDFGCMGMGDPACDLVIAWAYLKNESRKIFKTLLAIDTDTWARARGWALWKALITIATLENKTGTKALEQQHIINNIFEDSTRENT